VDLLPASVIDADGDEILVEEETDVSCNALHEKTIGTNIEGEELKRVSDVETDPVR